MSTPKRTILDIIDHARSCMQAHPSSAMSRAVDRYTAAFDAAYVEDSSDTLNLFVFHVDVPDSHRVINYVDVQHDHGAFDYLKLASHFLWAGHTFNRGVRVYFVTSEACALPVNLHSGVTVVKLATNAAAPMIERVIAMTAYVNSRAFSRNTAFLDTDAYPNRSLKSVFKTPFDIGVTLRTTAGYMPLNEGVIFGSRANPEAVRRFFAAYLGTYERLTSDPLITEYYGDINRWRGGQLSLNAVACPTASLKDLRDIKSFDSCGSRIALLPCNTFNYWVTRSPSPGPSSWDRKFVLHLKGDSKRFIDELIAYQMNRAKEILSRPQYA
jgi:hypothetical protein